MLFLISLLLILANSSTSNINCAQFFDLNSCHLSGQSMCFWHPQYNLCEPVSQYQKVDYMNANTVQNVQPGMNQGYTSPYAHTNTMNQGYPANQYNNGMNTGMGYNQHGGMNTGMNGAYNQQGMQSPVNCPTLYDVNSCQRQMMYCQWMGSYCMNKQGGHQQYPGGHQVPGHGIPGHQPIPGGGPTAPAPEGQEIGDCTQLTIPARTNPTLCSQNHHQLNCDWDYRTSACLNLGEECEEVPVQFCQTTSQGLPRMMEGVRCILVGGMCDEYVAPMPGQPGYNPNMQPGMHGQPGYNGQMQPGYNPNIPQQGMAGHGGHYLEKANPNASQSHPYNKYIIIGTVSIISITLLSVVLYKATCDKTQEFSTPLATQATDIVITTEATADDIILSEIDAEGIKLGEV